MTRRRRPRRTRPIGRGRAWSARPRSRRALRPRIHLLGPVQLVASRHPVRGHQPTGRRSVGARRCGLDPSRPRRSLEPSTSAGTGPVAEVARACPPRRRGGAAPRPHPRPRSRGPPVRRGRGPASRRRSWTARWMSRASPSARSSGVSCRVDDDDQAVVVGYRGPGPRRRLDLDLVGRQRDAGQRHRSVGARRSRRRRGRPT